MVKNMITIINAEEQHIPDICKLWWEFIQFHADIEPFFTPKDDAAVGFENDFLRPSMNSVKKLVQVALDGKKVVGYSVVEVTELPGAKIEHCGCVDHLVVTESHRRLGIGEKMYVEILKWLLEKNIHCVQIQLTAKNELACSFWRKQGYKDLQHTWYREI
jgi:GNAT superfamily N-acetyltransferase